MVIAIIRVGLSAANELIDRKSANAAPIAFIPRLLIPAEPRKVVDAL
jgi:hypothetical protein